MKLEQRHLEDIIETKKGVEGLHRRLDDISQSLFGNGEPEKGLVYRVLAQESFIGGIRRIVWLSVGSAMGALIISAFDYLKK